MAKLRARKLRETRFKAVPALLLLHLQAFALGTDHIAESPVVQCHIIRRRLSNLRGSPFKLKKDFYLQFQLPLLMSCATHKRRVGELAAHEFQAGRLTAFPQGMLIYQVFFSPLKPKRLNCAVTTLGEPPSLPNPSWLSNCFSSCPAQGAAIAQARAAGC